MKEEFKNYERLREFAFSQGVNLFGIADIVSIRDEFNLDLNIKKKYPRAISLGKVLLNAILEEIEDRPTKLYFHHYRQINFFLDRLALLISCLIQDYGFSALPIPASQVIDWEKQRAHLSHKKVAYFAGLGWIGRNNLLVNPQFGSRFRLVTILTDMPLKCDIPLDEDCKDCLNCISSCPAGAIKNSRKDFDHFACFEKLKEFKRLGICNQYICGVCVKSCEGKKLKV